jgi:hypothetical protein
MGSYMWEIDDPDLSHAFETSLWELTILGKHFHPIVAKTASLMANGELGVTKKPTDIFKQVCFVVVVVNNHNVCKHANLHSSSFLV